MKALGWPAAVIIGIAILVVELLPIVFGTGEDAVVDWSLTYVTFRFILLPLLCVAHVVVNSWLLILPRDRTRSGRLMQFASIVIPFAYLVSSFLNPLPLFDRWL
jgi:hypothetical protein